MTKTQAAAHATTGRVLHSAAWYDVLVWLLTRGGDRALRERLVDLAQLTAGETVLDVGCGTGSLALVAKQRVGPLGEVFGIDASPRMVARAAAKAARRRIDVHVENAVVEALPFQNARFDAVFSTLMLHHLPRTARLQCAREIRRVLKPGGRVLVADFSEPQNRHGLLAHVHRHGHVHFPDVVSLFEEARFHVVSTGSVGVGSLRYLVAVATA